LNLPLSLGYRRRRHPIPHLCRRWMPPCWISAAAPIATASPSPCEVSWRRWPPLSAPCSRRVVPGSASTSIPSRCSAMNGPSMKPSPASDHTSATSAAATPSPAPTAAPNPPQSARAAPTGASLSPSSTTPATGVGSRSIQRSLRIDSTPPSEPPNIFGQCNGGTDILVCLWWDRHSCLSLVGQTFLSVSGGTDILVCLWWDRHSCLSLVG